jgi:hypothetical protein
MIKQFTIKKLSEQTTSFLLINNMDQLLKLMLAIGE